MAVFQPTLGQNSYQTTFPLTESVISERGRWVNGLACGADWSDISTSPGKAYGTQTGAVAPPYDDSWAILTLGAAWTDTQVEAQVVIPDRSTWSGNHEVELILRATPGKNSVTAYEALFSVNSGTTYHEIVRWNGALGQFTSLTGGAVFDLSLNNGDWIKATIIGGVIQLYKGATRTSYSTVGSSYDTSSDNPKYTSGWPGYGHWRNDGETVALSSYGISSWYATKI